MVLVHRENRKGYKAGALREGLKTARGEFIAIFDADFVVPRDFLQRTIHYFTSDKVAMVEGRWGHLNRNRSYLTQAQASWLDAHMFIEQGGKNREGLWVHFHGTGGVWRKTAITDAGGWLERTVTEDGDLSYRALLRGWNMVYLRDYESPAELPPTMQAYLAQQYRWHKGGAQVFKFLVGGLVHSSYLAKIKMTTLHRLVNPFLSPVSLFSILLLPIVYLLGANVYLLNVGWILLWSVLTPAWLIIEAITYRTARLHVEGEDWSNKTFLQRWSLLPIGVMLNIGTIVHKSWAVVDALFGKSLVFERTPKYNSVDGQNVSNFKEPYKPKRLKTLDLLTLGAALYALTGSLYFGFLGIYTPALFYLFNSISFLWVGITPFLESRPAREQKAKLPPAQTPLTHRVWTSFGRFFPEEWHASVKTEARFTAGWEFFLHWVFPSLLVYAATAGLGMVGISVSPEKLIPALAPVWGIVFYYSHRERGPPLAGMAVYLTTLYGFGALFLSWGGGFVFLGVTLVAFGLAGHMAYDTKYIPLNSAELTERDRQNMAELADKTENNVREKPNELPILDDILSQPITPLGVGEKYRMAQELVRDIQQPQGARELKAALREKGVDVSNIESIRDFFASILPGRSQLFFVSRKDELTEDQWETMGATLRSRYRPGEVVIVVPPHPDVALRQILTRHGLESFIAVVPNDGYVHVGTGGKWILAAVERIPLVRRALAGSPFVSLYSVPSAVFDRAGAVSDNLSEAAQRVHSLWEALNSFSIQRTRLEIVDILARAVQQSA